MTERSFTWRMVFFATLVGLAWTGLGVRLVLLHFGANEGLKNQVQKIRHMEHEILVGRGRVLDANENIFALDLVVKDVCVDPQVIQKNGHEEFIGSRLSAILDVDRMEVMRRIRKENRRYERIKRYVHQDVADRIERMNLQGVFLEDVSARYYPHAELLSHIVGYSNKQGLGSAGVELCMDKHLKGRRGLRIGQKDGRKREVYTRRSLEIPPQAGCDVHLTIDMSVQYIVEQALDNVMETQKAKGAWAIVQDVRTGKVLAMASRPTFDLNQYGSTVESLMMNRPIGYTYEPGSTMKALTLAAALNEGVVQTNDMYDCEEGMWYFSGRPLRDYHPYAMLSVADILQKSSNIGTAKIAIDLGEAKLERYLEAFGVGQKTGIDLPGEESGLLAPRRRWTGLSISRIPMGHEVAVTAMHIASIYSTIANKGFRMRPYVVDKVAKPDGTVVFQSEPEVLGRPIREETSTTMCQLLHRVSQDGGTAKRARVEGYSVAGKTGTAEKVIDGRYSRTKNVASFVGFLPAEDPEVTIVVVVDEPEVNRTGGAVAGPVFSDVASKVVRYLDIPPGGRSARFLAKRGPGFDEAQSSATTASLSSVTVRENSM